MQAGTTLVDSKFRFAEWKVPYTIPNTNYICIYTYMIFVYYNVPYPSNHYLQYHEVLTDEYSETSWYVTLSFSMLSLCCHNTLDHYLHCAKTLADSNLCSSSFLFS